MRSIRSNTDFCKLRCIKPSVFSRGNGIVHCSVVEDDSRAEFEKYFRDSTIDELMAGYVTQGSNLTPFFVQHDQVMSVAAETTANGGTQVSLAYFSFGKTQATTGIVIGWLKYTGRDEDADSGL